MDQSKNQEEHCITLDFTSPDTRLESPSQARRQRNKWGPTEDVVLCNAWLSTSKDSVVVVGDEPKLESFWKRIANYYNASPKLKGFAKRESKMCKQRWGKIHDAVSKFLGSYEDAKRQKSTDQSEKDVLRAAYGIYFNEYKLKFSLEHAWIELRNSHKWLEFQRGSKKRKLDDQSASNSKIITVAKEVQEARPEVVVKAAYKAKGKSMNVIVVDSEEEQSETSSESIKEKDFAWRERLGKHKMLNTLLARKEPLSELESALKDKLITDMLNN